MKTKSWMKILSLPAMCGLVLVAGCGKKEETTEQPAATPAAAPAATPIDPATAASVSGTVKFEGTAPPAAKIDMSQDPACKGTNTAEAVVATGGHLANVFVYVKDGLGGRSFDIPKEAVTLDQSGCKYHPHMLGVMAGPDVKIWHRHLTTHHINPPLKEKRGLNRDPSP